MAPSGPGSTGFPEPSSTETSQPGSGRVGEPGLIASSSMPAGLATIGQPVSVCHQGPTAGTPGAPDAQREVYGSSRSPARKRYSMADRAYSEIYSLSRSALLL